MPKSEVNKDTFSINFIVKVSHFTQNQPVNFKSAICFACNKLHVHQCAVFAKRVVQISSQKEQLSLEMTLFRNI